MDYRINFEILTKVLGNSCEYRGNNDLFFDKFKQIEESEGDAISWIKPGIKNSFEIINSIKSTGIICDFETFELYKGSLNNKLFIITNDPKEAFVRLLVYIDTLTKKQNNISKIHPTAILDANCKIGKNVKIGAYSIIDNCEIGDNTIIGEHVRIFPCVSIGNNCVIREFVTLGGKGLGYIKNEDKSMTQIPHIGSVIIEDNVHIFPFVNIDQGTLGATRVGKGSAIDHHVHIAHNASVGENSILVCGTVMAGGSKVLNECFIGGNTQIKQKCIVGNRVITGMGSVVVKDIPDNEVWAGNPAVFLKKTPEQMF